MSYSLFSVTASKTGSADVTETLMAQPPAGTCNVSNATPNVITALTGKFLPQFDGLTITVNGLTYTFTYTDSTHGTLAAGPGTLAGVNWSFALSAEQAANDQCVNDAGAGYDVSNSTWLADVDNDIHVGAAQLKAYRITVADNTGAVQAQKVVVSNDQTGPAINAADFALQSRLAAVGAGSTGRGVSKIGNVTATVN